ncbi:hypothetical protein COU57_05425 [Candidatus Pacearchaeota archaeon CG10_big_fil_rev_8_21_14_0_10_32_14]|nr:MAG: hypothetical protein COU57_05425 [Candidatus Pacearchaeota archaeon CG10_big_fil_rev_8_21_14_0_10_32_14]
MKKKSSGNKKLIFIEVGKILIIYLIFLILSFVLFMAGFSCALHPTSQTSDQKMFCSINQPLGFIFIFGYPIIPLILYLLLRLGKGPGWNKVGILSVSVLSLTFIDYILYRIIF